MSDTTPKSTKIASLALPTRDTQVITQVIPGAGDTLLFLAELNLSPQTRVKFLADINKIIEASRNEIKPNQTLETKLESILLEMNEVLEQAGLLLGNPLAPRCSLGLALVKNHSLVLSIVGRLSALVVSGSNINFLNQTRPKTTTKISFQELSSGQLEEGDNFLLLSSNLFDFYPPDKLKKIFNNQVPGLSLREIERTTSQIIHHPPLGIIAVQSTAEQNIIGTAASVEKLLSTQNKTSLLLKPKFWPKFQNIFNQSNSKQGKTDVITPTKNFTKVEGVLTKTPPPATSAPEKTSIKIKTPVTIWTKTGRFWRNKKNQLAWLKSPESAKTFASFYLENKLGHFQKLPTGKKVLLILAAILIIVFSQSIVSIGKRQTTIKENEKLNNIITKLTSTQTEIEAALIYHNDQKARDLLNQSNNLLAEISATHYKIESIKAWQNSFKILAQRIDRLFEINQPITWLTLPQLNNGDIWTNFVFNKNNNLIFSRAGETAELNLNRAVIKQKKLELHEPLKSIYNLNDKIIIKTDSTNYLFDPLTQTYQVLKNLPKIVGGGSFDNKFYFLAENPRFIFRVSTDKITGVTTPTRWLKNNDPTLNEATSLTIDGTIYTATSSAIQKYVLGNKKNFNLPTINPPLSKIDFIKTFSESDYLYLINQKTKRLVILDKNARLVAQITFPYLPIIYDISIDTEKNLYLLDGLNIYQLYLPEFTR